MDAENSSLKEQVAHLEQCLFNQEKKITELKGTVQKYKRVWLICVCSQSWL